MTTRHRDGTCIRDYVHVMDLADAHVRGIDFLARGGQSQPLNLGTGQGFSIREVLAAVEEVTGKAVPYFMSGRRVGDPSILKADPSKAKRILSWTPINSDLHYNVSSAFQWMSNHVY
jgi:UDP-glucose 4-epimerase